MSWKPEIKTDALDADSLEALWQTTCNGFAFDYIEAHENAVVKDALVGSSEHCYVYDADLDVTIDPTLGQFEGYPDGGAWDGDEHPHVTDDEIYEWTDREAFVKHYSQHGDLANPFHC